MALDVAQFKQTQRRMWSIGNYPDVATMIVSVAEEVVAVGEVGAGQEVLDVATGTGNAAILAAQSGATVTGLDLTPELLDAARRRIAEAGVDSPDAWISYCESSLGPTILAKHALELEGKWDGIRTELVDLFESRNQAGDGTMRVDAEYLLTVARLPG